MGIRFPSTIMEAASGLPTVVESIISDGKLILIPNENHFLK